MSDVIRYRQCGGDAGHAIDEMMIHAEGEWVEYSEYETLDKKVKELEGRMRSCYLGASGIAKDNERLQAKVATVEEQVVKLTKRLELAQTVIDDLTL